MTLKSARAKLAAFNAEFNTRMEAQRLQESEALRAALDQEVWALHDLGWSVNKIAKEYGTTDWKTVNDIVKRKPVPEPVGMGEVSATLDGFVYTVRAWGETAKFTDRDGYPWFDTQAEGFNTHGPLAEALRSDAEFYEMIINMTEVN